MNKVRATEQLMRDVMAALEEVFTEVHGERMGIMLLVFEFDNPGMTNYISNATRDTMLEAMKETIKRFENGEVIPAVQGEA